MLTLLLLAGAAFDAPTGPPEPFGAVPTPAQIAWHDLEFYGFIHFTTNTFTDKEWGFGDESPSIFDPSALDCVQWAKVAKDCGMKGLILTAKHHDGFCLWPSALTEHSVQASPFKDGKGDVVREFADATRGAGLKVGLYLSPWDRHHARYAKPEYAEYYRDQWKELISTYGPVFEIWQDGANGGDGFYGGARDKRTIDRTTYYDWPRTNAFILSLAPDAIIFSDAGPGCRWVGNEHGYCDEESWQTLDLAGMYPGKEHDHLAKGDKGAASWVGVEVDVSIRPGWFYHPSEDAKVKTPAELVDIWYNSVGRGANLILNVPPDRRGVIHENDQKSLAEFGRIIRETFKTNLALGKSITSSSHRGADKNFDAAKAIDADRSTFWTTDDDVRTGELVLDLGAPVTFDVFSVREFIPLGQRVEKFTLDAWKGSTWSEIASGTTIGPRRIMRIPVTTASKIRLRLDTSLACPTISDIALYKQP